MDEKTNEALLGIATQVTEWLKSAGDLVTQEAPLLAQEVIKYGVFNASIGILYGVLLGAACVGLVLVTKRAFEKITCDTFGWDILTGCSCIGAVVTGISALNVTCTSISLLGKTLIAPRLYLLEQMAKLVN